MAVDIFNIKPQVISRSLSGKTMLLAASPKYGKSTFAANGDKVLIAAFEMGTNAIPGAMVAPMNDWTDFKRLLKQLEDPRAREMYHNIAIDTVQWAWELCTKYICVKAGVQNISDVAYGKLYKERDDEFKNALRKITMLGYGAILISHTKTKEIAEQISDTQVKETTYVQPDLDKRCLPIVNALVDIIMIGTIEWDKEGKSHRYLLTRSTPTITAGSRFRFLDEKIPFSFKDVEDAVARAIEKEEELGAKVVDEAEVTSFADITRPFSEIEAEARELWSKLVDANPDNAPKILRKVELIFGRPMKLSEIQEGQEYFYEQVVEEMRSMAANL